MTCPRCHGLVIDEPEDVHCINCGWRKVEPWQPEWKDRTGSEPVHSRSCWSRGTSAERAARRKAYKAVYMKAYRRKEVAS